MKYLFLMTIIVSSTAFAKKSIKLSDLGKINYEKILIQADRDRIKHNREREKDRTDKVTYQKAHYQKYGKKPTPISSPPAHSPFTKYNSDTQSWDIN